jgi:hypothetical protein
MSEALSATTNPPRRLLSVTQCCEQNPAFSYGGLRWLLFNRQQNGLDRAVVRVGRRVLIGVDRFFEWLDTQSEGAEKTGK